MATTWCQHVGDWADESLDPPHRARAVSVAGPAVGPTRAEVAAVLLAIQAEGGVHVCTDSKAAIRRVGGLRRLWGKGKLRTLNNSDVWATLARALANRGWDSLACSWIKAHQEGPAQTLPEATWRAGNEKADGHAKRAARAIHQAHIQ
eukprot:14888506-Alexandrium_andersonii.AAC.1